MPAHAATRAANTAAASRPAMVRQTTRSSNTLYCWANLAPLLFPTERRFCSTVQKGFRVELTKNLDKQGDNTGPTRLVTGPDAGAIVAMEVLVEQEIVPPVRISLEFSGAAKNRPAAAPVLQEDAGQAIGDLVRHLVQVHDIARTGRALDFEVVAVIGVVVQQRADYQRIDRHPDRTAPVRVPAEHASIGLR